MGSRFSVYCATLPAKRSCGETVMDSLARGKKSTGRQLRKMQTPIDQRRLLFVDLDASWIATIREI